MRRSTASWCVDGVIADAGEVEKQAGEAFRWWFGGFSGFPGFPGFVLVYTLVYTTG